jgi:hypothetical protein
MSIGQTRAGLHRWQPGPNQRDPRSDAASAMELLRRPWVRQHAAGCGGRDVTRVVGDTGFEPVTSSVSRKRATAAPIAPGQALSCCVSRWVRDLNPCRRICSPLPRLSANPPWRFGRPRGQYRLRADDEARTRDLNLGKVALYQLSYVRLRLPVTGGAKRTIADAHATANSGQPQAWRGVCAPRLGACACGSTAPSWTIPARQ